jgi:hypothetical protein
MSSTVPTLASVPLEDVCYGDEVRTPAELLGRRESFQSNAIEKALQLRD